jgi:hypothetical protein
MKTKVLVSVALSTIATGALAQPNYDFAAPPALPAGATVPSLYASEQGAYAAIEGVMQAVESIIVLRGGCAAPKAGTKVYNLTVNTDSAGSGSATATNGATLTVRVARTGNNPTRGNAYQVSGGGELSGTTIAGFNGSYAYNIGSTIMASNVVSWTAKVNNSPRPADPFTGTVIKDFWRADYTTPNKDAVSSVWDYGLQQVSKLGWPKDKYWQASRTWRDDGIDAETHFLKTRVAPTGGCEIGVDLIGLAGIDSFQQTGTLTIYGPAILPTKD